MEAETPDVCSDTAVTTDSNTTEFNEYSYLCSGGFSTENFKIEIRNMPKFYGISELKKLLTQKLELKTGKIKPPRPGSSWLYVCFHSEEERIKAITALQGYQWKGKTLSASVAQPAPDPLVKKRKLDSSQDGDRNQDGKKSKQDTRTQDEKIKDSTTPYWNMPYEEQIAIKQKEMFRILQKLGNELWKIFPNLRNFIETKRKIHKGLMCEYDNIKTAKRTEGYRNKCEFTVGMDEETKLRTVGFRIGSYVTGFTGVAPVDKLCHISEEMKAAVLLFQDFVRSSDINVYSPIDHSGNWSGLMVRQSSTTRDLMLVVGINPQGLSSEILAELKNNLTKHFSTDVAQTAKVSSLYFQEVVKKKSGERQPNANHLWGETHIYETIHGIKFRVSPEAFFQINTEGAEILYQTAIDMAEPTQDSTILDICCGTGTIGLCFAKHCGQVLGLEMIPEAITDAKFNATSNSITNADFFVGKAEDVLYAVTSRASNKDVIAIIDPPRAGLHVRAVTQIRKMSQIKKLVFVSCDPAAAMKNFIDLSRAESKTMHGDPFIVTKTVAVDMFPYTKHTELVLLFERMSPEEFNNSDGKKKMVSEVETVIDASKEQSAEEKVTPNEDGQNDITEKTDIKESTKNVVTVQDSS